MNGRGPKVLSRSLRFAENRCSSFPVSDSFLPSAATALFAHSNGHYCSSASISKRQLFPKRELFGTGCLGVIISVSYRVKSTVGNAGYGIIQFSPNLGENFLIAVKSPPNLGGNRGIRVQFEEMAHIIEVLKREAVGFRQLRFEITAQPLEEYAALCPLCKDDACGAILFDL